MSEGEESGRKTHTHRESEQWREERRGECVGRERGGYNFFFEAKKAKKEKDEKEVRKRGRWQ